MVYFHSVGMQPVNRFMAFNTQAAYVPPAMPQTSSGGSYIPSFGVIPGQAYHGGFGGATPALGYMNNAWGGISNTCAHMYQGVRNFGHRCRDFFRGGYPPHFDRHGCIEQPRKKKDSFFKKLLKGAAVVGGGFLAFKGIKWVIDKIRNRNGHTAQSHQH